MHVQNVAHPVTGAVAVLPLALPERLAGNGVDLATGGSGRELQARESNVALEDQREVLALLIGRRANGYAAGNVGGAVQVLDRKSVV